MKIFGIPLKVEPAFLMMAIFMGYNRSDQPALLLEWASVVFISILVHELGHALAGRRYGLMPQITLHLWGGLTSWENDKMVTPAQNLIVSLAGPAAGILLGFAVFVVWRFAAFSVFADTSYNFYAVRTYQDLLWVNFGWGLFNLLPTLPLDGGHATNSLENWFSPKTQGLITEIVTVTVGTLVATWAFVGKQAWVFMIMGWCVATTGTSLYKRWQKYQDAPLQAQLTEVRAACDEQDGKAVVAAASKIFAAAKSDWVRQQSLTLLIQGHLLQDNVSAAQQELQRFKALFGADVDLEATVYFKAKDWERAILLLEPAFHSTSKESYGAWLVQALIEAKQFQRALEYCQNPLLEKHSRSLFWTLQAKAFYDAQYECSNQVGRIALAAHPHPTFAYNIACGYAQLNQIEDGIEWLSRAVELGFSEREELLLDDDLQPLRAHPEFANVLERLTLAQSKAD